MRRRPCGALARRVSGTPVAILMVVRALLILVGILAIGCARPVAQQRVTATSPARLAWLHAEVARAQPFESVLRGAYLPQATGAGVVCSVGIQIDAWYGAGDERWELTHASNNSMQPARATKTIREELQRIGIANCVLDMNR